LKEGLGKKLQSTSYDLSTQKRKKENCRELKNCFHRLYRGGLKLLNKKLSKEDNQQNPLEESRNSLFLRASRTE